MISARDQAIEVVRTVILGTADKVLVTAIATAVVDALLAATQEQTCPTCGGTGWLEHHMMSNTWKPRDAPSIQRASGPPPRPFKHCPDCTAGVVPGTEPLVLLGPEQVGWQMCCSGNHPGQVYRTEDGHAGLCPDCVPVYRRAGSPDDETHYPGWQRDQAILGGDPSL